MVKRSYGKGLDPAANAYPIHFGYLGGCVQQSKRLWPGKVYGRPCRRIGLGHGCGPQVQGGGLWILGPEGLGVGAVALAKTLSHTQRNPFWLGCGEVGRHIGHYHRGWTVVVSPGLRGHAGLLKSRSISATKDQPLGAGSLAGIVIGSWIESLGCIVALPRIEPLGASIKRCWGALLCHMLGQHLGRNRVRNKSRRTAWSGGGTPGYGTSASSQSGRGGRDVQKRWEQCEKPFARDTLHERHPCHPLPGVNFRVKPEEGFPLAPSMAHAGIHA